MPRALINVHAFLQDFSPNKFIVYTSTLIFCILLSLRFDNTIIIPYWLIFLPLWIWKSISFSGAIVGILIWLANPDYRISNSSYIHFKSMLISFSLQILLLMFEILVCDKLETKRHTWTLTFIPLIFVSLLSISVCIWSVRNGRGIDLEFFAAINFLQIILIPLRLDNFISWSWVLVFVPSWTLLFFTVLLIFYAMVFAAVVLRSPETGTEQRRASIQSASSASMIFLPMLMFVVLLTSKLDSPPNRITPGYFFMCTPLFLALLILIRYSFGSKPGSLWWFGMRRDFCSFLLHICPCLKEYGNTTFIISNRFSETIADLEAHRDPSIIDEIQDVYSTRMNVYSDSVQVGDEVEEGTTKKLLNTLNKVFLRNKSRHNQLDKEATNGSVIPKLTIDTPD